MSRRLPLVTSLALTVLLGARTTHGAEGQDLPRPQPSLPPEARSLQIKPLGGDSPHAHVPGASDANAQPQALVDDITALRQAVERVRNARAQSNGQTGDAAHPADTAKSLVDAQGKRIAEGPRRGSAKLGAERLSVQRFNDGYAEVNAAVERESLETVLRELASLLGRPLDDNQLGTVRRQVSLHLSNAPWEETLDRLLGQVGLSWRESSAGGAIVILDQNQHPPSPEQLEQAAQRALLAATRDRQTPVAAEALYLLGARDLAAGRYLDAMRRLEAVAEEYGPAKDTTLREWGNRAIRGVGDAMMALKQFQDARGVYLNYIARTDSKDPELPAVYLAAAKAGHELGRLNQDAVAFDEAIDTLHNMLERFGENPAAAAQVTLARLTIGEMLFDAGRFREAETQLMLFDKASGGKSGDQIAFWLAECAFQQDHIDAAKPGYERLFRSWRQGHIDASASPGIYATAAFRIGQCYERGNDPKYVNALFSFLRARQAFPQSPVDAELLIEIARCYAELERDDDTVAALWELLKEDGIVDPQKRQVWLDDALGKLNGRLGDYAGPVRAKVLFYIAQADYRRALRDRRERTTAAGDAVHHYERVLAEDPPKELRHAAQLGLARAALLGGQDERGASELRDLLRDPSLSPRDRDYAAQQLGGYYRDKGKLREAIKAFRGEVE